MWVAQNLRRAGGLGTERISLLDLDKDARIIQCRRKRTKAARRAGQPLTTEDLDSHQTPQLTQHRQNLEANGANHQECHWPQTLRVTGKAGAQTRRTAHCQGAYPEFNPQNPQGGERAYCQCCPLTPIYRPWLMCSPHPHHNKRVNKYNFLNI